MKLKRTILLFALTALLCVPAFCASLLSGESELMPYDSIYRLENWDFNPRAAANADEIKITLITVTKGDPVFSWFGHAALMVTYPTGNEYVYDFGTFSMSNSGFYLNFAMGRLWYSVIAYTGAYRRMDIALENRTATYVELNLPAGKKAAIASFLADNIKEGNDHYLYHYYLDNCATRLRDIINYATDGEFEAWARRIDGSTFRKQAGRHLAPSLFWDYLLNFLQGPSIDTRNTLWDDMFLPSVLERAVIEFGLAKKTGDFVDSRSTDTRTPAAENYSFLAEFWQSALVSIIICCLLYLLRKKDRRGWQCAISALCDFVFGVLGLVLFFMMFFTDHSVTFLNENILFVNPVLLWLFALDLRYMRKGTPETGRRIRITVKVLLGVMLVLILLKLVAPSLFIQKNWQQILTVLPVYAVRSFFTVREKDQ